VDRKEIPALTGIRGVAACWVVFYHVHEFDALHGPLATLLRHGYLAVDIFFVLSGLVMGLSYSGLFAGGFTTRKYGVFLARRAARIYPLYLVVTLVLAALPIWHFVSAAHLHWLLRRLVLNLSLVDFWGFAAPIDGPSWSISTELAAYLLFPILALLTIYGRAPITVLVAILCVITVAVLTQLPTPASYPFPRQGPLDISWAGTIWPLVRCVAEFTLGLAAFRAATETGLRRVAAAPWLTSVVFAALFGLLLVRDADVLIVCLIPVFLVSLACADSAVARGLASSPIMLLGRLSYAIYLLHFPLLPIRPWVGSRLADTLGPLGSDATGLVAFWCALLILAGLCYRFIEVPGRKMIRRVENRLFAREDRSLAMSETAGARAVNPHLR
jgi:peptidoglycan/LPS O-acetylase OafA/YrhL